MKKTKTIALTGTQKPFLERSEILNLYYNDIRNNKVLSQEETLKLFEVYNNGSKGEKEIAKKTIFEHNAKLVTSMARQYCTANDNLMDLIQEGNLGLLNAIEKFDATKESSFQKFALFHIRREINLFKINYTPIVRQTNRSKTDNTVNNIVNRFVQKEQRIPTDEEILEIYNEENSDKKINEKKDIINVEYVFIDNFDSTTGEFTDSQGFVDYTEKSASNNNYIHTIEGEYNKKVINILMEGLTPNEKKAISLYYGLNGGEEAPLASVAGVMGCTPERARQLCNAAVRKMKKNQEITTYSI